MKIYIKPVTEIEACAPYLLAAMSTHDTIGGGGQLANDAFFDDDNLSSYTNKRVWGEEDY